MRSPGTRFLVDGVLAVTFCVAAVAANGTIYTFRNPSDGIMPLGPLVADAQGNLYGTAFNGGVAPRHDNSCWETRNGCGLVFKLTSNGSGGWDFSVIHEFQGLPNDAEDPTEVLAIDKAGNIYGTTYYGPGSGSVYELSPTGTGTYTEKVLYSFTGGTDGNLPTGVLVDGAGNLYGTTTNGGAYNESGVAWELSPDGSGGWTEQTLHSFGNGNDGQDPRSALTMDAAGNLFGTTSGGGANRGGTVFELSPAAGGGWTETVLYSFGLRGDGCYPYGRITIDAAGNLYSTTQQVCDGSGYGTVFELSPSSGGYTEKIIHHFLNSASGRIRWLRLFSIPSVISMERPNRAVNTDTARFSNCRRTAPAVGWKARSTFSRAMGTVGCRSMEWSSGLTAISMEQHRTAEKRPILAATVWYSSTSRRSEQNRSYMRFWMAVVLAAAAALAQEGLYKVVKTAKVGGAGGFDYVYADPAGRKLYVPRPGQTGARVSVFDLDTLAPVRRDRGYQCSRSRGVHQVSPWVRQQ